MGEKGIHDYQGDIVNDAKIYVLEQKIADGTATAAEQEELQRRYELVEDWKQKLKLNPTLARTHNIFELGNIDQMSLFWILMLYMAKSGQGDAVREIILKLFDGSFEALKQYAVAAHSNRITAWGAGRLTSCVLERFGIISQTQAADFTSGISIISGFQVEETLANQFIQILPWVKAQNQEDGFPDQITIAGTEYKVTEKVVATPIPQPSGAGKSITLEKKEG